MPQETTLNFAPKEGIRIPFEKIHFRDTATEQDMCQFVARLHPLLAPAARLTLSRKVATNPMAQPAPGPGWRLVMKFQCEDNSILTLRVEHVQLERDISALTKALLGRVCNERGSPAVAMVGTKTERVEYI